MHWLEYILGIITGLVPTIIFALLKYGLRKLNNKKYEKDLKNAPQKAYEQTGEDLKKGRKEGRYVDGSAAYKQHLSEEKKKAKENRDLRGKFIDELKK